MASVFYSELVPPALDGATTEKILILAKSMGEDHGKSIKGSDPFKPPGNI